MNTFNLEKEQFFSKGITLIALVITIIILLILAGISIAMLTGDNGILTKADTARNATERADIIEGARVKILEKQTENLGSLTEQELTDILTPAYGTLSNNDEETVLDKTLTTTDNKYQIPVKEIWNGNLTVDPNQRKFAFKLNGINCYFTPTDRGFKEDSGKYAVECTGWLLEHLAGASEDWHWNSAGACCIRVALDSGYVVIEELVSDHGSTEGRYIEENAELTLAWYGGGLIQDLEQKIHY